MAVPTQTSQDQAGVPLVQAVSPEGIVFTRIGSIYIGMGTGSPNGEVTAPIGSIFVNKTDGDIFSNTDGVKTWAVAGTQS